MLLDRCFCKTSSCVMMRLISSTNLLIVHWRRGVMPQWRTLPTFPKLQSTGELQRIELRGILDSLRQREFSMMLLLLQDSLEMRELI